MATQLQRAYGIASGKESIPALPEKKPAAKREAGGDKKADSKRDPYPNLPRRPFGIDQEA